MAIGLMMAACSSTHSEPDVLLRLDGPGRVRVDQFGPVQGPGLLLEDGSAPEGVQISVEDERVASVQRNQVVAEGPGETRVTAEYGGQTVQWTLVVAPVTVLNFSVAPAELAVGDQVRLEVVARTGDVAMEPAELQWTSSDPALLSVSDDGLAQAREIGLVYVTARTSGSQAMVEIDVVAGE